VAEASLLVSIPPATNVDLADIREGLQYFLRRQGTRKIAKGKNRRLERCHHLKIPMLASDRSLFKPISLDCRSLDTAVYDLLSLGRRFLFGHLIAGTPPDTKDLCSEASYNNHRT